MKKLLFASVSILVLLTAFVPKKKNKLKLPEEFILIPERKYYPDWKDTVDNRGYPIKYIDSSKIKTVSQFYISRYEVSNRHYREFYNEVSKLFSEEEKLIIKCDSTGWRIVPYMYNESSKRWFYHRHPAFNNYPVVNISYEGIIKYCQWLQQKIQEQNPDFEIEVKLPAKEQWVCAAEGGRSQAMFPWANYYHKNKKGEYMCNYRRETDYSVTRNRETGKPEVHESYTYAGKDFYIDNVKSYHPNDFDLYNMCGNAAEMIAEKGIAMGGSWNDYGGDVKIRAESKYEGPLPTVGFRPIVIAKLREKK